MTFAIAEALIKFFAMELKLDTIHVYAAILNCIDAY